MAVLRNVAFIGAAGNIGSAILDQLVKSQRFRITIITRQGSTSVPDDFQGVTVQRVAYEEPNALIEAFTGQDAVVAALNSRNPAIIAGQKAMIEAAVKAGIKRFIPSEFGSDTSNPITLEMCPFLQGKVDIVNFLKTQEGSGLTWSAVVNGGFFDWGLANGHMGYSVADRTATLWDAENPGNTTFTNLSQIGRAIVAILSKPEETANRYIFISSFMLTGKELLEALELRSVSKWTVVNASTREAEKQGREQLEAGNRAAAVPLLLKALTWRNGGGYDYALYKSDNALLGLPKESLFDTIDAALQGRLAV